MPALPRPFCSLLCALPQFLYLPSGMNDRYSMERGEILPVKPGELLATKSLVNPPLDERLSGW